MPNIQAKNQPRLWFDVGRERDTTLLYSRPLAIGLWFDVGRERYNGLAHRPQRWAFLFPVLIYQGSDFSLSREGWGGVLFFIPISLPCRYLQWG